ncbi:hypothetical protein B0H13DRAFT_1853499 [Mycena leptocephala]|nr:hypothetical protein B0H13DRAFT_1853499 [Mycena leptocephala]
MFHKFVLSPRTADSDDDANDKSYKPPKNAVVLSEEDSDAPEELIVGGPEDGHDIVAVRGTLARIKHHVRIGSKYSPRIGNRENESKSARTSQWLGCPVEPGPPERQGMCKSTTARDGMNDEAGDVEYCGHNRVGRCSAIVEARIRGLALTVDPE